MVNSLQVGFSCWRLSSCKAQIQIKACRVTQKLASNSKPWSQIYICLNQNQYNLLFLSSRMLRLRRHGHFFSYSYASLRPTLVRRSSVRLPQSLPFLTDDWEILRIFIVLLFGQRGAMRGMHGSFEVHLSQITKKGRFIKLLQNVASSFILSKPFLFYLNLKNV